MPSVEQSLNTSILTLDFADALNHALRDEMRQDPRVFVFGLDVQDHKCIFGSTRGVLEEFGRERCVGTPLSEDAMTGVALGLALSGLRPVHVHIRVDFLLLAMNQLANMIANTRYLSAGKLSAPLVIRAVIGRGWGQGAQHSKSLQSIFAHIPGLKVVMPTTAQDAYTLLRLAIQDENPVLFLEHRWLYYASGTVDKNKVDVLGEPSVLRAGKDLTIVATSWMNIEALKAAEVLAKRGIQIEVVDVRSIAPLNDALIVESARKTHKVIVADYDWVYCGFGAEIASRIMHACFGQLDLPVERVGFEHTPCPTTRPLENEFYPNAVTLIRKVEKMLGLSETDLSGETFYSWENRFKGPF